MKSIIFSFVFLFSLQPEWLTTFDKAKEIAGEQNKLILLNFSGSDWCAPCIRLKKEVFENENFLKLADEKLVLVRADFPRLKKNKLPEDQTLQNEKLAAQYNAQGKFPLTVLLDANGTVLKVWDGYQFATQDKFIKDLQETIAMY